MNASEYLNAAADLLEKDGWVQGIGHDGTKRCMGVAMSDINDKYLSTTTIVKANKALEKVIGNDIGIIQFNDKHCRTKNDAIAVFRIAADLAS